MQRNFDDWITTYIENTKETEPPEMYRLWVAISTIAAVMQRKCYLKNGCLKFHPNFYIILISPPGQSRKGTAIDQGNEFLTDLNIPQAADASSKEAIVRRLRRTTEQFEEDDGEVRPHSNLNIISPELTSLIGDNDLKTMSWFNDWFDGGKGKRGVWEYETISRDLERIEGIWVNLLGATTPDLLSKCSNIIGSGLSSRMIFVFEKDKNGSFPLPKVNPLTYTKLLEDLEQIHSYYGGYFLTQPCIDYWKQWYTSQDKEPPFTDDRLTRYCQRRGMHVLKLCMVLKASEGSSKTIGVETLRRAINIIERTELNMPMTFGGIGESNSVVVLSKIMTNIDKQKKIKAIDLFNDHWYDVNNVEDFNEMINVLKFKGFCCIKVDDDGVNWIERC